MPRPTPRPSAKVPSRFMSHSRSRLVGAAARQRRIERCPSPWNASRPGSATSFTAAGRAPCRLDDHREEVAGDLESPRVPHPAGLFDLEEETAGGEVREEDPAELVRGGAGL